MPVKIERSQFSELIESVKADDREVAVGIKGRVAEAQSDAEVVMMGGWTTN
ncbi:hypothetical protein [Streptomyces sp. NPDC059928]|uniref:hypothetical protein n=1 Tax=unclassified Streptomyces TaxID=2593676 RepID=UPI003646758C